jgi:hypothetical protein
MKKTTILFVLFSLVFSTVSLAGNIDLFDYDKDKISHEMAQLNALESFVLQNGDVSYDDLLLSGNPLVADLNTESALMLPGMVATPILPAFWWGCILGPVGVLIVYILEDDPSQTKSAFWGCLISTLLWGGSSWFWYIR